MKSNRLSNKFPLRYFLYFSLLIIIIVFLGFSLHLKIKTNVEEDEHNHIETIAHLKANQVKGWITEKISDANYILNNPFKNELVNYLSKRTGKAVIVQWLRSVVDWGSYERALLLDNNLEIILSDEEEEIVFAPCEAEQVKEAASKNKIILSDLHYSEYGEKAHMTLSIPLHDLRKGRDSFIGILNLRINPYKDLYPLIQSWPSPSISGETLLLRRENDEILYLNELRFMKGTALQLRQPIGKSDQVCSMAAKGIEQQVKGVDYRNIPVLAAIKKIEGKSWYLVAKIDLEEIEAPLRFQLLILWVIVGLMVIISASVIAFLWRHQRAQFYKELYQNEIERKAELKHYDYMIKYAYDIIFLINEDGEIIEANERACSAYGYSMNEFYNLHINDLKPNSGRISSEDAELKIENPGGVLYETQHCRKDGTIFDVEVSGHYFYIENKKFFQAIIRDISQRKLNDEKIRKSELKYRQLFENINNGFALHEMIYDQNGRAIDYLFLEINPAFEKLTGLNADSLIGKKVKEIIPVVEDYWIDNYAKVVETGEPVSFQNYSEAINKYFDVWAFSPEKGKFAVIFNDATDRKKMETDREITIKLLRLISGPNSMHELMKSAAQLLRDWSGCQAIGIRMQSGNDYPYFETLGFPENFVLAESSLCITDVNGQILRDELGNPILECMCGNILRSRFNPDLPFFTPHGSFWTNSTSELLASTSEEDRQARTRNRCNGEGYESVALIPLRVGDETFGLLQFNDPNKNKFTIEKIEFYERLADNLAIGLAQKRGVSALKESEEAARALMNATRDAAFMMDKVGTALAMNDEAAKRLGAAKEEALGYNIYDFLPAEVAGKRKEKVDQVFATGKPVQFTDVRNGRIIDNSIYPVFDSGGKVGRVAAFGRNITEMKKAEEKIQKQKETFQNIIDNSHTQLVYLDNEFNFVFVNDAYAANCKMTKEELIGKNHFYCFPSEENENIFKQVRDTGQAISYTDKPFTFPDQPERGVTYWDWTLTPVRDNTGIVKGLVFSLIETTERKKAEMRLKESENRFHSMFEKHGAVMLLINPADGKIIDANTAALEFYGYSKETINTLCITDINVLPPEIIEQKWLEAKNEKNDYFVFPHRLADGQIRKVEVHSSPILISNKTILFSIIHDITERESAKEELHRQLNELKRWHKLTSEREFRIIELKQQINKILEEQGRSPIYMSVVKKSNKDSSDH